MNNFDNDLVSIVVRTLANNKRNLERALFSIYCSDYRFKEVIVIYQGLDNSFYDYFNELSLFYKDTMVLKLLNNNTIADQRSKNLNIGIENASGRFLAFLDDDDFVSYTHYSNVISLIKEGSYCWGYSNCIVNICEKDYVIKRDCSLIKDYNFQHLLIDNFIPIHSFVIDRLGLSIHQDLIKTDETLTRLEDYYIVLNLASRFNPIISKSIGAFYNLESTKISISKSCQEYASARKLIERVKNNIIKSNKNSNDKDFKSFLKVFFRMCLLSIFFIPNIGSIIVSRKKAEKFFKDIKNYLYKLEG